MIEERTAKMIFNKNAGTASKSALITRVTIPVAWAKQMNITQEEREIKLIFDGENIIIEKNKKNKRG